MLSERVEEWSRQIEARSENKGRREVLLHLLETKFGQLDARTTSRVKTARPQSLLKWAERVVTAERLADVFGR